MLNITPEELIDLAKVEYANAGNYHPSLLGKIKGLIYPHSKIWGILPIITDNVIVLDISFYQSTADFEKMISEGVKGVIIRAGQNSWKDDKAEVFMTNAEKAGMPIGSYWFYDSRKSPQDQAKLWKEVLGNHETKLGCWADYEETYGGTYQGWKHFYDFLETCKVGMFNRRFGIYTGYYYWLEHSPNPITQKSSLDYFAFYPLWLAWYTNNIDEVKIPKPWSEMLFWQKTSKGDGVRYGVGSLNVDVNLFTGTLQEYKNYFKLEDNGNGGTMSEVTFIGKVKAGNTAKVRQTAAGVDTGQRLLESTPIEGVGTLIPATLDGTLYHWMNLISPVQGWVASELLDYSQVSVSTTEHKLEVFIDGILEFTKDF